MNVKNAIVQGENYRFTVLTPSMIRMEYSEKGVFVDKKTQMVVNRTFDVPEYTVNEKNGELIIETDKARLGLHWRQICWKQPAYRAEKSKSHL